MSSNGRKLITNILDGCRISEKIRDKLGYQVSSIYKQHAIRPGLDVIRVGDQLEMERYVFAKQQLAFSLGINFNEHKFPPSTTTEELQNCIHVLNHSKNTHGIIVQLPLPKHIHSVDVLNCISPIKDVDGCHTLNQGRLVTMDDMIQQDISYNNLVNIPCAAMAMLCFLDISIFAYSIPVLYKHAVVIGRSSLVGLPCFSLLQHLGCTCTIVHEYTQNIPEICRTADIIVSAVGKPGMIKKDWLKENVTIIDIGTRCVKDEFGKYVLVGDTDMDSCIGKADNITPVPGGVALLTTSFLMMNTLRSMVLQENLLETYKRMGERLVNYSDLI